MILDSPRLENTTILTGSFEITGTVEPGDNTSYDLGTSSKRWRNVYTTGLTGSLTKTATGVDYLQAGSGIQLVTGSAGQVTISATVAGSSLVAGSNTQVQFNDGGTFGADSGLRYNKTTQALTGTYVVASTGFSGSLTKLASGADYLVAGSGITISTGSNGSVTMSLGAVSYATASFTNVTSVTVNHPVGTTLYDIEVFDTTYSKIIPKSATATSPTQANITFGSPTSGYVAVGAPTAGGAGASVSTQLVTGSVYLSNNVSSLTTSNASISSPYTLLSFNIPSAGTWDISFVLRASLTAGGSASGAIYNSSGTRINDSAAFIYSTAGQDETISNRFIIKTNSSGTYTLRAAVYSGTLQVNSDSNGITGVVWSSMGGGSSGEGAFGDTNITTTGQITGSLVHSTGLITGSILQVTGPVTASSIELTGNTQRVVNHTAGAAPYFGLRAWASVSNAHTTPTWTGYNISSVSLVSTGLWDVTFTTAGYANVNSLAVFILNADTNYDIMYQYDKSNSNTSKIRIRCVINTSALYSTSAWTIGVVW